MRRSKKQSKKLSKNELFDNYTNEDWKNENDIKKLHTMTLNWKIINGKWNDVAEKKMREVGKRENLTESEKYLLYHLGYYEPKTFQEKILLEEKEAEIENIEKDFCEYIIDKLENKEI